MDFIIDFFYNIYRWVISLFSSCFSWLLDLLSAFCESVLVPIASAIPDLSSYWASLQVVQPYTAFVNQWVALDTALVLISAYFVFVGVMIPTKLIIKLFIPMVG